MAGEAKVLRKRKSSSARPRTRGQSVSHQDDRKHGGTSVFEIDRYTDSNRTKKSVLFQGKAWGNSNTETASVNCNDNYPRPPATATGVRSRLQSARSSGSSGIASTLSSDMDSTPRPMLRHRRSVSAHPALRTQNSVPPATPKSALTRTPSKSCLSPRNSDDQPRSSRSLNRSRQRVERLKLRSSSVDSSDSDDYSPRASSRPLSQPLSPEILASMTSLAEQNKQAWNHFSTHVKLIDDSTGLISRHPRKTFASSSVFQKAMHDMYGNSEYGKTRGFIKLRNQVGAIASCASKLLAGAKRMHVGNQEKQEDDEDLVDTDIEGPSKETVENAKRGWRILRQYVQDMASEKRLSQTNLTWNILTHAIRGLSNMERTRYELYQKYGLVPMVLSDGTVIQENTMLSERARAAQAARANNSNTHGNGIKHCSPTRLQSAPSHTHRSRSRSIGGFKATSMTG